MLITAVGMSFIVQNISLAIYGVGFHSIPSFIPRSEAIGIGDITYSWNKLAVLLITIPVLILLTWFVRSTKQGKAMRAVAQDTEASAMMGINVNRTISVTFALAGALAGAAAIVYLLQFNMRYDTGFELGLIAFTAAVLGGIGNLTGAVLGALIIGFIQAFNEGLTWYTPGSDWTRTIVFGILILILVFRPGGPSGRANAGGSMTSSPAAVAAGRHRRVRRDRADPGRVPLSGVRREPRRPAAARGLRPGARLDGDHDGRDDDGDRPQHRRRLRGPARPRLRRLLRGRRLHGGLVGLAAVRPVDVPLRLRRDLEGGAGHPPLDLARPPDRRLLHGADRAS